MILTRDGKEITAVYRQDGSEVDEVKDAAGRLIYTASREITGTLPLSFTSRGNPLTDYLISGNTVQDGTPTPEAPVDAMGCGVRTGNLFNAATVYGSMYDSATGVLVGAASTLTQMRNNFASSMVGVPITITIRADDVPVTRVYIRCTIGGTNIDSNAIANGKTGTMEVTVTPTSVNDDWRITFDTGTGDLTLSDLMLNRGSTALPYEPYGYKIPPTVNGTEYPIYLGQVPTTRRIKKLVLNGTERSWARSTALPGSFFTSWSSLGGVPASPVRCTHAYDAVYPSSYVYGTFRSDNSNFNIRIMQSDTTLEEWKKYLSDEYSAGTPVTVWYVLAEPDTGIVNEPLMKIGDYADTISFTQAEVVIPTVNGANVLDMSSPVKSSEVYIKGKGIKAIT